MGEASLIAREIVCNTFLRCAEAAEDLANKLDSGDLPEMNGAEAARIIAALFRASAATHQ